MAQQDFEIIAGPGKFELMLGLFERKQNIFTMKDGKKFLAGIMSIQVKSTS